MTEAGHFTEIELSTDERPLEEVRCRCGDPLRLDFAYGAGESEVLLSCDACHIRYVITVRCD